MSSMSSCCVKTAAVLLTACDRVAHGAVGTVQLLFPVSLPVETETYSFTLNNDDEVEVHVHNKRTAKAASVEGAMLYMCACACVCASEPHAGAFGNVTVARLAEVARLQ